MRRKLLIGALSVLTLILLLVIGVFIYLRSGRLDNYLREKVVEAFADVGITAKIGSASLDLADTSYTARNKTVGGPMGTIGSAR